MKINLLPDKYFRKKCCTNYFALRNILYHAQLFKVKVLRNFSPYCSVTAMLEKSWLAFSLTLDSRLIMFYKICRILVAIDFPPNIKKNQPELRDTCIHSALYKKCYIRVSKILFRPHTISLWITSLAASSPCQRRTSSRQALSPSSTRLDTLFHTLLNSRSLSFYPLKVQGHGSLAYTDNNVLIYAMLRQADWYIF